MADLCKLKGCDQPPVPPTFWRDERFHRVTGQKRQAREEQDMTIETNMTAYQFATDAIAMFLEYRDVHGYDEQQARVAAATDAQEGVNAEAELRAAGGIN